MEGKTPGYSVDSNIMATSGAKDIDAVTLATIKLKSQEREYEIVDDPIGRIKLKNYSSDDSSLAHEKPLHVYYCSLCGAYNLVTTVSLSTLKVRRTDRAMIIPGDGQMGFQRYFSAGKVVLLKRTTGGLEKQWRWCCKECGVLLAYQCMPHTHIFPAELSKPSVQLSKLLETRYDQPLSFTPPNCFYVLDQALATDAAFSAVVTEVTNRAKGESR